MDFWLDPWVPEIGPLIEFVPPEYGCNLQQISVAAMASPEGDWLWHKFQDILPSHKYNSVPASGGGTWLSLRAESPVTDPFD
ncbi:hypothetical protein V6N13_060011 [Hibiscus sabdariffa]